MQNETTSTVAVTGHAIFCSAAVLLVLCYLVLGYFGFD